MNKSFLGTTWGRTEQGIFGQDLKEVAEKEIRMLRVRMATTECQYIIGAVNPRTTSNNLVGIDNSKSTDQDPEGRSQKLVVHSDPIMLMGMIKMRQLAKFASIITKVRG